MQIDLKPVTIASELMKEVLPDVSPEIAEYLRGHIDDYSAFPEYLELEEQSIDYRRINARHFFDLAFTMLAASSAAIPEIPEYAKIEMEQEGLRQAVKIRDAELDWQNCGQRLREIGIALLGKESLPEDEES